MLQSINLDQIFSNGYSFLVEMMFKCQRQGYTVGEIPIIFANRTRGQSKISQGEIYRAMYTVLRLFVNRWQSGSKKTPISALPSLSRPAESDPTQKTVEEIAST